ncbi:hypothetical protein COCOBI_02-6520 [Coccomyxa sp. Obi]|nr:hypothetical protein COCOBI_02-6520 [Coccomyxa sp. Obi]
MDFQEKFGPPDSGEWYGRPNCTLLEALLPSSFVKPYFDFELSSSDLGPQVLLTPLYCTEEPDTWAVMEQQVLPPILKSLEVEREEVRVASRHGWVKTKEGQRFKVSFRAFVLGKQLRVAEMNTVIGRFEFQVPGWDKGVYPYRGERMMAVVGGVKGKDGDKRVREPVETGNPYHEYLIQALDGNEEVMEVPLPKYAPRSIARSEIHSVDAAVGHSLAKPEWLTLTDESMLELASDYMELAKMKEYCPGPVRGNTVSILNKPGVPRLCVHIEKHVSNNASVLFYKDQSVVYKCYAKECIDKDPYPLGTWQTKTPTCMDELTTTDLMTINTDLIDVLAQDPKNNRFIVEYLNRFLISINISKPEIVELVYTEAGEVAEYRIRNFGGAGEWFTNNKNAFNTWKESTKRRFASGYEFEINPNKSDPKRFNLFSGKLPMSHLTQPLASLSEDELRYLQPILDHLHQHFCAGEVLLSEYLLNWLAFPLQKLGEKTGVAVVVKGLPGTGKGLVFNKLMSAIYDEHYVQCKDIHDLTGGFNSLTAKKMLVNLDEATFEKYKDSVQIKSYVNLVITTNEDFPVAITEGDRRYFVLETSRTISNNHPYWDPIVHLFEADLTKTSELFYRYLMHRDLSDFRVRHFPETAARAAIMVESRDNVTAFLQDLTMKPDAAFSNEHQATYISTGRLYELYKMFVDKGDVYGVQMKKIGFARRLKALLRGFEAVDGMGAVRNMRERGFMLPKSSDLKALMKANGQWCDDQDYKIVTERFGNAELAIL